MQAPLRHVAAGLAALSLPVLAHADEPLAQRAAWEGTIEHLLTGATLAEDKDKDGDVDGSAQPASFDTNDVPASATLVQAVLYWGGTRNQASGTECVTASSPDDEITVTFPSGTVAAVTADASYCSGGGSTGYDVWTSNADLTTALTADGGDIRGDWTIEDYVGKYSGGSTDNASAALLLVYEDSTLPPRRVVLYDGNQLMESETDTLALTGFDADSTPDGTLTYYVLEGDVGPGSGTEQVEVSGVPGGASLVLSDAINPANNPMNRTINTTTPTQEGVTGVDIDQFDITAALTAYDTQLDVTYQASSEKWWLVVNVVGVKQYAPHLGELSTKTWTLHTDADGDGQPTPGDTIHYTIHLENSGNESATVDVTDPIPPEADSWTLVSDAGGTDRSTAVLLDVRDVTIAASGSADIVFDVVIGDVPDETAMDNTASWSAPLEGGGEGSVTASTVTIRADGDGDGSYTNDDCNDSNAGIYPGATEICDGIDQDCDGVGESDGDSDGWLACEECNDADGSVNPGATEVCNGKDDDCDSAIDEGVKPTWYADGDLDGYGGTTTSNACTKPSGYVALGGDCDDTRSTVNPAATETCNGRDDDCDGVIDEADASGASTWYADDDKDGYGDLADSTTACNKPSGYVSNDDDCDDTLASVNPAATEICNGRDDNCAGGIDEGVTSTYWADGDSDGFGDETAPISDCSAPSGYVANDTDCDDSNAAIKPGATEVCNGVDDDCDTFVDEGAKTTYYADSDGDGWGTGTTTQDCTLPSGYAAKSGDCDDTRDSVNPDAIEACNGRDDDCDGATDESGATGESTWYADTDKDGYGGATTTTACNEPSGYVATGGDCDDTAATTHPTAPEICDGVDNDCDLAVDEGASGAPTWYADVDKDGYGDLGSTTTACSKPTGYVSNDDDCDDSTASVSPAALEACNGIDDDCDGVTDEDDATDATTWYVDGDGDTWGTSVTTKACAKPTGYASRGGDCADADSTVNPGAAERCNGKDDDCDGVTDEADATDALTWYRDADSDGHGGALTTRACSKPSGYVATSDDCDDADATTYTGATEICDGIDNDCDGVIDDGATGMGTWYADVDKDGYGDPGASTASCSRPTGYVNNDDDCADADATVNPAATELCNGKDDDCDGVTDESDAADADTFYADGDTDGYGGTTTATACSAPTGYVAVDGDCDDAVFAVNPGATEYCNGRDDDCDGVTDEDDAADAKTWYRDADADSFGDATLTDEACSKPGGYVADATDCDDGDASVWPGAPEICDGIDNDCDTAIDEGASGAATWYADTDLDGYGDASAPTVACTRPSGHVSSATDCDDTDSAVNPAASERCNGIDDDCDTVVDEADAIDAPTWYADADADTYGDPDTSSVACTAPTGTVADSTDCDDTDDTVHPLATEACNGIDDDCDTLIDEGVESAFYLDADGDGYGDPDASVLDCTAPSGTVANDDDCDDAAAAVHPGATEACNGIDDDCDGVAETDGDGDGYLACEECDDAAIAVHPGAIELCNAIDDDCDGATDEDAADAPTWYADADLDGYGDASAATDACTAPTGTVADDGDCDDTDASVHPDATEACNGVDDDCDGFAEPDGDADGFLDCEECDDADPDVNPDASELCNGVDDDCDGATDEDDAIDADTWYADGDLDGYGDATDAWDACAAPEGYVGDATDCDDTDATVHPGAAEIPYDGVDQDCDGADWTDVDGDGYAWDGVGGDDCDDTDADVHPGAAEAADGRDEDCDGTVDEGTEFYDDDGDGYTEAGGDCDDTTADIAPNADEICDAVDEDCDGIADNGTECYDDDGDDFSEAEGDCSDGDPDVHPDMVEVDDNGIDDDCDGSVDGGVYDPDKDGYTSDGGDCEPTDAASYPGADEVCDGVDNDCDGTVDEGTDCYDDDGDGWTETFGDCDDADPLAHEGADEDPSNGRDDDCDGLVDEGGPYTDDDGDGFSEEGGDCDDYDDTVAPGAEEIENGEDDDCDGEIDEGFTDVDADGYTIADGDCDDRDGWTNPGAVEFCDGKDNNCNGDVDEEVCEDEVVPPKERKCGCAAPVPGAPSALFLLIGALAVRRRRSLWGSRSDAK